VADLKEQLARLPLKDLLELVDRHDPVVDELAWRLEYHWMQVEEMKKRWGVTTQSH